MTFLKLFTGVTMSQEFEKLKNKVAVAAATISHQNTVIADLTAKLAAVPAPAPVVEVTDADYAALGKVLDDVFAATPSLAPIADVVAGTDTPASTPTTGEPVSVDSTLAVDGLAHPAFA
jgi:hypothetical protein